MDISALTIQSIHDGLRHKAFSCTELVRAYLDRIAAVEPTVHAFLHVARDGALASAAAVDEKIARSEALHPLGGIPIGIKDVLVTAGMPTTAGSKILEGYQSPYDATVVEKLRQSGAVLIGKTNCDEFAMGASGENSAFGPTANPWDPKRVPGGSSSGSAAAVAAGECVAALGTDTGGSVRQPAGFCNVVGLKPTYGRVSRYGLIALASSLDQVGTFTRTVDDAAILLRAIAGKDSADATSVAAGLADEHDAGIRGLRIGVPKEYFGVGAEPEVEQAVHSAIALLEQNGATIREVSLPHTEYGLAVYYIIQPAEASANLARYDGIRYGKRLDGATLEEVYRASRAAGFGPEPQRRIMLGTYALSAGYCDAYYKKAQKVRTLIRQDFTAAFRDVDVLITPTSPSLPFSRGERTQDPLMMYLADLFTVSANIAGIPGISVPAPMVSGLPVGVQLLGPMWSEPRLLTVGRALERAFGQPLRLPQLS